MHRVELKGSCSVIAKRISTVPNAPCGVERVSCIFPLLLVIQVPNAPCGVERKLATKNKKPKNSVPNAPCGVESYGIFCLVAYLKGS